MYILKQSRQWFWFTSLKQYQQVQTNLEKFNLNHNQMNYLSEVMKMDQFQNEKLNLIIYLIQRLNPSTQTFKDKLCFYIMEGKLSSNSEIEKALKYLKQKALCGMILENLDWRDFESTFFQQPNHNNEVLVQEIVTLLKNEPTPCKFTLRKLCSRFPSIPSKYIFEQFNLCRGREVTQSPQKVNEEAVFQKLTHLEARDLTIAVNNKDSVELHRQRTNGKVHLRFPPEPNGYLHLGHVRSIWLNFDSASKLDGVCYLRYDDTNPKTEKQDYIDQIRENVEWFGYKPSKITYASDYFDEIHESAIYLIENGHVKYFLLKQAYVCEQSKEEIHDFRRDCLPSPYRNRSVEDSLKLFQEMKEGLHEEAKYTLRLRIDHEHQNPTLRDPVIYRVRFESHPRTGTKWKIYPLYDFAHCICDSIEDISHSLCTLEFEIRRELYYWILDKLKMWKPTVYEFSRLNISRNILSKRKIQKLVEQKIVDGWDDPRLMTLAGLKNRGYTQSSLISFIQSINLSRSGNENIIQISQLESFIRRELDDSAPRIMCVLQPIELILENVESKQIKIPLNKKDLKLGERTIAITNTIYIESSDFKLVDEEDFYGLAPGKQAVLKYFAVIQCTDYIQDTNGKVTQVFARVISELPEDRKKHKGQLHWISDIDAIDKSINEYDYLFNTEDPSSSQNYLESLNSNSLVKTIGKVPKQFDFEKQHRVQFERLGFYYFRGHDKPLTKIIGLKQKKM